MKKIIAFLFFILISLSLYASLPAARLTSIDGKAVNTAKLENDGCPIIISFFCKVKTIYFIDVTR